MRRRVLITGASSGLGLECAKSLVATGGFHVLLAVRDPTKGERVRAELADPTAAEIVPVDLASLASVASAAARLAGGPALDAIVCNAGVHTAGAIEWTADGLEMTFGVNHVAHQLLVTRLMPHLVDDARVVVVSSGTHDPATLEGRHNPPAAPDVWALAKGLEGSSALSAVRRYTSSKLCNILFAAGLDRRLRSSGRSITVNTYDPGAVPGTALTRSWSLGMRALVKTSWLLRAFGMAVSTPARAGAAMARLVADPHLAPITGRYFQLERERQPSVAARDPDLAARLLEDTQRLLDELAPA